IPIRQKNATDGPSCRDAMNRVFIQGCVAIIN
ncbi:nucleoside hydrolase, partial [Fischerella muscicola CCMEE 5323]